MSSPLSLLPARTTPVVPSSQHAIFEEATAATATSSTSPPGRWRRARAKRVRDEINKINERTEKATWEKQFENKLHKMAEESVKKNLNQVHRQARPAPPPIPNIDKVNTAESINPSKRARLCWLNMLCALSRLVGMNFVVL